MKMKTWFITGAATSIGRCIAEAALKRGDCVAAVDVRMDRIQDYTERFGERVWEQRVDVTDGAGVRKTFAVAVRYFDAIDVCVNNAGLMYLGAVEDLTGDEMRQIMDVNYMG